MKARLWVVGKQSESLRKSLNHTLARDSDRVNPKQPVRLKKQKKQDRPDGWSWVLSRNGGKGSLKYRWNSHLRILECWAVAKVGNRPSQLMSEFVETLLSTQKPRVRSIHIEVS